MSTPTRRVPERQSPTIPSAAQITALQAIRDYPAISLLLTTTPAPALGHADALRLDALAEQAVTRVRAELQPAAAAPAIRRLRDLLHQAHLGPTGEALALYASATTGALIRLPVPVRDRAVVDPTFATRDLVRALHRTPRHLVLALNARQARLFDGVADSLLPALTHAFPLHATRLRDAGRGRADRPTRSPQSAGPDVDYLRQVDQALGAYARLHPAPLIIVGDDRITTAFRHLSVNCARLAGVVRGNLVASTLPDLTARIRETLNNYLHRRETEALTLIDQRTGSGRVASGMPAAWLAARTARPEMLAVEETLFYPARLSDDGDNLVPALDVEHPDVIDDAVDELIELVLLRGGWVALTSPGTLSHHEGVALTLRR